MTAETVNKLIALGTIAGQIIFVFGLLHLFTTKEKISYKAGTVALFLSFGVSLVATLGSLYYSEIVNFPPCKFCWLQRIFLFPQVIILALAYYKKDFGVYLYSLSLSIIGGALALNHSFLQAFNFSVLPCNAKEVSCEKVLVVEYGYITIPVMSLTIFLLLILAMLYVRRYKKENSSTN